MFTRCPHCETVHYLNAALIARAAKSARCGNCNNHFRPIDYLYDDHPAGRPDAESAETGEGVPTLGRPQPVREPAQFTAGDGQRGAEAGSRWLWYPIIGILALLTLVNLVWIFQDELRANPTVSGIFWTFRIPGFEPTPPFRDPASVHLVSRDIHTHPSRTGFLVLSATFVNLAAQVQPYPRMVILLLDSDNAPLAARQLQPEEYLPEGIDPAAGLRPGIHIPVLVEFADPGKRAIGFEIEFR